MVVREGEEVVRIELLVVMAILVVDSNADEVEGRVEEVVLRRVVGVVVAAAPGTHCEVLRYTQVLPEAQVNGPDPAKIRSVTL